MKTLNHDEELERPCAGRSWLFDQVNALDHLEARSYCLNPDGTDKCPFIADCRRMRDLTPAHHREGTWAGELFGADSTEARRIVKEELRFTDAEAKACHNAWRQGARSARIQTGHRVYIRRERRARAKKTGASL